MYKFNVSAPGRVFLNGDPSKYNEISIAASLNMRTTLAFTSIPISAVPRNFIEINFPYIMLHVKIPLFLFNLRFNKENFKRDITDVDRCYEEVIAFVSRLKDYCTGTYQRNNRQHYLSLHAFFFLLALISYERNIKIQSSFIVAISSELPIAEGLGSSASFVVCLAACFYRWSLLQKGLVVYEFDSQHLIDILKYAQWCESLIYNSSNTIDAVVSVYGSLQVFDKEFAMFTGIPSMKILLVFSNVSQKIKIAQNEQVKIMNRSYSFIETIRDTIKAVFERSVEVFGGIENKIKTLKKTGDNRDVDKDPDYIEFLEKLSTLIQMNQGLLRALGMSHPNVDVICTLARDFSLAGKITNNGGGYAFILLRPNCTDEIIENLMSVLESHNFFARVTNLNCSGLRIE